MCEHWCGDPSPFVVSRMNQTTSTPSPSPNPQPHTNPKQNPQTPKPTSSNRPAISLRCGSYARSRSAGVSSCRPNPPAGAAAADMRVVVVGGVRVRGWGGWEAGGGRKAAVAVAAGSRVRSSSGDRDRRGLRWWWGWRRRCCLLVAPSPSPLLLLLPLLVLPLVVLGLVGSMDCWDIWLNAAGRLCDDSGNVSVDGETRQQRLIESIDLFLTDRPTHTHSGATAHTPDERALAHTSRRRRAAVGIGSGCQRRPPVFAIQFRLTLNRSTDRSHRQQTHRQQTRGCVLVAVELAAILKSSQSQGPTRFTSDGRGSAVAFARRRLSKASGLLRSHRCLSPPSQGRLRASPSHHTPNLSTDRPHKAIHPTPEHPTKTDRQERQRTLGPTESTHQPTHHP